MKLRGYLVFAVVIFETAVSLNAQKNPVQEMVSSVVSCVSKGKQRQQCSADTSAGVVMLRPTGEAACLLGRNWGYDEQGVWVSEGCGGDFATGSTTRSAAAPVPVAESLVEPKSEESQVGPVTTGENPALHYLGYFEPYGSLRTILAISSAQTQVQDDASRIGINFTTRGPVKVFAKTEWGVNLLQSESSFNVDATPDQGFGTVTQVTNPVFIARLGYVGVDFGPLGQVSFGKQNSTHYDITSYTTDRFNVFGGQASATYVAGTDGGTSGTGRADQVVLYSNKFARVFQFGAQGQFRGANLPQAFNGFGFSLQATVNPELKIGGAYNKTYFSNLAEQIIFPGGTDYWTFGATGSWHILEYGAVWAREINGDLVFTPNQLGLDTIPVVFSANGLELYSKFKFGKFAAVGGFIDYMPRDLNPRINPNFKTRYAILGAEWHVSPAGYAFVETRLGDTTNAEGQGGYNAAAVGFRYDFSWKTPHLE